MKEDRLSFLRRVAGLSLMVLSLILFSVLIPSAMSFGLYGAALLTWLVVICFGLGSFLLLRVRFHKAAKSLLVVLVLSIPWFAIFLTPLPSDIQLLLAVFVASVVVLIYRYSFKSRSSAKDSGKG
jgi:uncharacterized membrane protein YhaH (DUF805 family)